MPPEDPGGGDEDVAVAGYRIACETGELPDGLTGSQGHCLADGVVVSPLLEMRALAVSGGVSLRARRGAFPAADGPDPLDLTLSRRQAGDVSPREAATSICSSRTWLPREIGSTCHTSRATPRPAMNWIRRRWSTS